MLRADIQSVIRVYVKFIVHINQFWKKVYVFKQAKMNQLISEVKS